MYTHTAPRTKHATITAGASQHQTRPGALVFSACGIKKQHIYSAFNYISKYRCTPSRYLNARASIHTHIHNIYAVHASAMLIWA